MPDRLTRVSDVMRATIWSFWFRVSDGTLNGRPLVGVLPGGVVAAAAMVCANTGTLFCVMTKFTLSVVTLGLTIMLEIVAVLFAGTVTVIGRPPKAKLVDAVKTKTGRPL